MKLTNRKITVDTTNCITESGKYKHLSYKEHNKIETRLGGGYLAYRIAKELNRPINTVLNEIKRDTVIQIKGNKNFENAGQVYYEKNLKVSRNSFKRLECNSFITYVIDKVMNENWSLDCCFGRASNKARHLCPNP